MTNAAKAKEWTKPRPIRYKPPNLIQNPIVPLIEAIIIQDSKKSFLGSIISANC